MKEYLKENESPLNQVAKKVLRNPQNDLLYCLQAADEAVNKGLKDVMNDEKAPASARVSAARAMIDMGIKASDIMDLESRIENLEGQLSGD